jgi:hypothetical protein
MTRHLFLDLAVFGKKNIQKLKGVPRLRSFGVCPELTDFGSNPKSSDSKSVSSEAGERPSTFEYFFYQTWLSLKINALPLRGRIDLPTLFARKVLDDKMTKQQKIILFSLFCGKPFS